MNTPTIKGIKLRPLNTYRWSTIREFIRSEHGKNKDQELVVILAYTALASSEELSDEEITEIGTYMTTVLNINKKAEFTTEQGKVE